MFAHNLSQRNHVTTLFNRNTDEFLPRSVTVNEDEFTTTHRRQRSSGMGFSGQISTEEGKVGLSAKNVIVIVFWDTRSIIHLDFFLKGRTRNGKYLATLLNWFTEDLGKTTEFGQRVRPFPPRQCKGVQVCSHYGSI